jgi:hypothetical protein
VGGVVASTDTDPHLEHRGHVTSGTQR